MIPEEYLIITFLRIFAAFTILKAPLGGTILSMLVDYNDYTFLPRYTPEEMSIYQMWDKILDTLYLSIAFYTSLSWVDSKAVIMSKVSYVIRLIGVILFLVSGKTMYLLFFPNFFENFFLFYMLFTKISKNSFLLTNMKKLSIITVSLLIPKLVQEYALHIKHSDIFELFSINSFALISGFTTAEKVLVQIGLYGFIPIAVLITYILLDKRKILVKD